MILPQLALSNFAARKIRLALTVAAIALSVSLVIAVTSGYLSFEGTVRQFIVQFMGTTDVDISAATADGVVPEAVLDVVRRDPRVHAAVGRLTLDSFLLDTKGKRIVGHFAQLVGVRRPDDAEVGALPMDAGRFFDASDGDAAVIDQAAAALCKVKVGGTISLPDVAANAATGPTITLSNLTTATTTNPAASTKTTNPADGIRRTLTLKVVGIVHKPQMFAQLRPTIYLPLATLQAFKNRPGQFSRILVDLNHGEDSKAVAADLEQRVIASKVGPPGLRYKSASETRKEMQQQFELIQSLSYLAGAVSLLSAVFIVFSTISMGVSERQRTLAMLRAIGAYRSQLARLVLLEGVIVAALGVAVGVPMGWAWVKIITVWKADYFTNGVVVSVPGMLLGSVGAIAAALLASLLPAWNAARVTPLEAMAPQSKTPASRVPWVSALCGLVLISLDPAIIYSGLPPTLKYRLHFAVGLPGIMFGFFLLAPLFVWTIEKVFSGLLARLLAIPPALLRQQLTGGLWRSAGTCAALMVGLACFVTMQVEGRSMLNGWQLPKNFPDFLVYSLTPLDDAQQRAVAGVSGIRKGDFLPIAIVRADVQTDPSQIVEDAWPSRSMFFGMDPATALRMMDLDFRDDNGQKLRGEDLKRAAAHALAALQKGRAVIVTDDLRQLMGLKTGGTINLRTPDHRIIPYEVAGIVWSPGLDVMINLFDIGSQIDQQTASSLFGSMEDARRDWGVQYVQLFVANLDTTIEKSVLVERVRENIDSSQPKPKDEDDSLFSWAGRALKATVGQLNIIAMDARKIKNNIVSGFDKLLDILSAVAFSSMLVAALGVANAVIASVRSRRWQFGVLRAVGVTRGQLLRLVLAEALLLGVVGCALGVAAGFWMSNDANGLSKYLLGYVVSLTPPWGKLAAGVAGVMAMTLGASLAPAIGAAREEPLGLLQAGRAAA